MTELDLHIGVKPLPPPLTRARIARAARFFIDAAQRWSRPAEPWSEVALYLVGDSVSAEVNAAILGHEGPTDVITQAYDPVPGDPGGLIGEIHVNLHEAARVAERLPGTDLLRETLLYIAHGCDHLTGADDATPDLRQAMRRRELAWLKQEAAQTAK